MYIKDFGVTDTKLPTAFKNGMYEAHIVIYTKINNMETVLFKTVAGVSMLAKSFQPQINRRNKNKIKMSL